MDKYNSRKYRLAKVMVMIATAMAIVPPLLTVWFMPAPLILLTGTEWASICGTTLLLYFGGNVAEKKLIGPEEETKNTTQETQGEK